MRSSIEPFFLAGAAGACFCVAHAPAAGPAHAHVRGLVLHLPAWAEEMNKSRRMVAMQSRALAEAGFAVLQLDPFGTGDSGGELDQATWPGWLGDVQAGAAWLRARHGALPLTLWGHRAGALLATAALPRLPDATQLLLWQPALQGKAVLQAFLRLKAAAGLAGGEGPGKGVIEQLKAELARGGTVEVAGYRLGGALATALEAAQLALPSPWPGRVLWLETSTRDEPALLPASSARVEAWRAAGTAVHAQAVTGPAFWQTTEIEDAPALLRASLEALGGAAAGAEVAT